MRDKEKEHTSSIPKTQIDSLPINHDIGTEVIKHGRNIILPTKPTEKKKKKTPHK